MFLRLFLILALFTVAKATITPSIASTMIALDSLWGLNFMNRYGSPLVSCNCTYTGTFIYPCYWIDTFGGFNCANNGTIGWLDQLSLSGKFLGTGFRSEIFSLTTLTTLILYNTGLTGQVPDLTALSALKYFSVGFNSFAGPLPQLPFNVPNCQAILQNNLFTGSPNIYGAQPNLQVLDLSNNLLSGTLIPNFVNSSGLQQLNLSGNALTGPLPDLSRFIPASCDLQRNNFNGCPGLTSNIDCQLSCSLVCPGNSPVAGAVCISGQWISPPLNTSGAISLNGTVVIIGDLSLNPETILIVGSADATLIVEGVVTLGGTLSIAVDFTNETLLPLINATVVNGSFISINGPKCARVTPQQDQNTFAVLISPGQGCQSKAAISRKMILILTFSILGGIVLVLLLIGLIAKFLWPTMPVVGKIWEEGSWR